MKAKNFLGSLLLIWVGAALAQAPTRFQPPHEPYPIPPEQQVAPEPPLAYPPRAAYIIPEEQQGAAPPEEPTFLERLRNARPRDLFNLQTLGSLFGGSSE